MLIHYIYNESKRIYISAHILLFQKVRHMLDTWHCTGGRMYVDIDLTKSLYVYIKDLWASPCFALFPQANSGTYCFKRNYC